MPVDTRRMASSERKIAVARVRAARDWLRLTVAFLGFDCGNNQAKARVAVSLEV